MSSSNATDMDPTGESKYFRGRSNRRIPTDSRSKTCSYSRNSSVLSVTGGPDTKYVTMKKLVVVINEYLQNKTEEAAGLVNRYLQALSVTIDLSIFNPHTNIACQFFVSLYDLMSKTELRSPFTWHCVDVLSNVCRNSAARLALIHTYQFLPSLSRMLGDQLSTDKKLRILKLMQDLTCGIKITWQIPHLPHLMVTLARWVESQEQEIVALSLGVLVNLCYKNLPAVYALTSNVEMKKLMRTCLTIKGPIVEAHACKLLIVCDHIHEVGPSKNLLKLVGLTFDSMKKALEDMDHIVLRQLVEFYIDVKKRSKPDDNEVIDVYEKEINELLKVLDRILSRANSEESHTDSHNLGECVALILQFIHYLIEMKLDCLRPFYPKFVQISLQWVQNEVVSPHSIAILKTIALNTSTEKSDLLKPLGVNLPVFLVALDLGSYDDQSVLQKVGALLQLLRIMLQVDQLKPRVLEDLKEETMKKVFHPLLGDDSLRMRADEFNTCSEEAVIMYTHAVALVSELAKHDLIWATMRDNLMQQRQIHYVLSQALYVGTKEVKTVVLNLAQVPSFPTEHIATAMNSMQNTMSLSSPPPERSHHLIGDISTPVLSVAQVEKLDDLMFKLKEAVTNRNFVDVSTSEVMELYEFKLASMGHAERAAMASVEAASERCAHFQHRTAQLTTEMNRLHQLLFQSQQRQEELSKVEKELEELVQLRTASFEAEKGRCKAIQSRLTLEQKNVEKLRQDLESVTKTLTDACTSRDHLEEQQTTLKHLISKLEDNCYRLEKNLQKKEDALSKSASHIEELRTDLAQRKDQVVNLEQQLKKTTLMLENKREEHEQAMEELRVTKQIIETITKVAQQHKRD